MKMPLIVFMLLLMAFLSQQKLIRKYYKKEDFAVKDDTLFLTKFDIGQIGGSIKIIVMHRPTQQRTQRRLNFSIVNDVQLQQFLGQPCSQYEGKPQISALLKPQQTAKELPFKIKQQDRQHIFYLYLQNCNNSLQKIIGGQSESQYLTLEITMLNGQSHFGEDQNFLYAYVILVLVWIALMVYFFKPIGDVLLHSAQQAKLTAFAGLIVIGIAYFYRLLHMSIYNFNGEGIYFFEYLYHILKSVCELIIVTFISAIGWGWSITHLKHDQTYILAGVTVSIINIIGMCVSVSADEMAQIHHKYDSTAGYILQILRIVILAIFFIGILRTLSLSVGNSRRFIKKFSLIGGFYLSSWPLIVVFSELFLPNYMHNEVINFVEEITHMVASALLCKILSNPDSTYRKVSMKQEDNPLKMTNYKHK